MPTCLLMPQEVYGELYRVLKPGGLFLSYEWVSTPAFDPSNPDHVRIIDEINFGNGLPEMRTWKQAEDAGKAVGFELVTSLDLATASKVAGGWQERLAELAWQNKVSGAWGGWVCRRRGLHAVGRWPAAGGSY